MIDDLFPWMNDLDVNGDLSEGNIDSLVDNAFFDGTSADNQKAKE